MPGFGELFPHAQLRGNRHLLAAVARLRRAGQQHLRVLPPGSHLPNVPHGVGRLIAARLDARTRPCNLAGDAAPARTLGEHARRVGDRRAVHGVTRGGFHRRRPRWLPAQINSGDGG